MHNYVVQAEPLAGDVNGRPPPKKRRRAAAVGGTTAMLALFCFFVFSGPSLPGLEPRYRPVQCAAQLLYGKAAPSRLSKWPRVYFLLSLHPTSRKVQIVHLFIKLISLAQENVRIAAVPMV